MGKVEEVTSSKGENPPLPKKRSMFEYALLKTEKLILSIINERWAADNIKNKVDGNLPTFVVLSEKVKSIFSGSPTDKIEGLDCFKCIKEAKEVACQREKTGSYDKLIQLINKAMKALGLGESGDALMAQKMQQSLKEGCCYGISSNKLINEGEGIGGLTENERIAAMQLLQEVTCVLIHAIDGEADPDKKTAFMQLQEELDDFSYKVRGFQQIESEKLPLASAISFLKGEKSEVSVRFRKDKLVFSMTSSSRASGHAVFVDLEAFEIHDINYGVYRYSSKDEMLNALEGKALEYGFENVHLEVRR